MYIRIVLFEYCSFKVGRQEGACERSPVAVSVVYKTGENRRRAVILNRTFVPRGRVLRNLFAPFHFDIVCVFACDVT